jgi:hypothetical protein
MAGTVAFVVAVSIYFKSPTLSNGHTTARLFLSIYRFQNTVVIEVNLAIGHSPPYPGMDDEVPRGGNSFGYRANTQTYLTDFPNPCICAMDFIIVLVRDFFII